MLLLRKYLNYGKADDVFPKCTPCCLHSCWHWAVLPINAFELERASRRANHSTFTPRVTVQQHQHWRWRPKYALLSF